MAEGIMQRLFGGTGRGVQVNGVTNPAPPPQSTQPNPNDKFPQNNPGVDPNKMPVNGSEGQNKEPISPLDQFKDIWKTPTPDPKGPPADPLAQPLLNNDPAKFADAAKKLNFTQQIDPALVKKALEGDPQAFMDAINSAAQTAFTAASQLSMQTVESAAQTNNARFDSILDKRFKEFLVKNERTENPVLQHPSAAPMLDLAKRQLTSQHPDKSPSEIHAMAEDYLVRFADSMTAGKAPTESQQSKQDFDFSTWER